MTTINADPTQPTTLTLTGPNDANVADASDVNVPFQSLLNNDARVATFYQSDLTALAALTGQQPNERIYVLGYGLYRYNQGGTNATVLPKYVAAAGGTGRWEWELATAAGVGLGLATLDSSGKLAQSGYNSIEAVSSSFGTTDQSTTSTTFADVPSGPTVNVGASTGDILIIDASAFGGELQAGFIQVVVVDGGTPTVVPNSQRYFPGPQGGQASATLKYTIVNTGTSTVKLQYRSDTGGNFFLLGASIQPQELRVIWLNQ